MRIPIESRKRCHGAVTQPRPRCSFRSSLVCSLRLPTTGKGEASFLFLGSSGCPEPERAPWGRDARTAASRTLCGATLRAYSALKCRRGRVGFRPWARSAYDHEKGIRRPRNTFSGGRVRPDRSSLLAGPEKLHRMPDPPSCCGAWPRAGWGRTASRGRRRRAARRRSLDPPTNLGLVRMPGGLELLFQHPLLRTQLRHDVADE
jgi:hypothetical protein